MATAPPARPRMAKRKPIVLFQTRELGSREVYAALADQIRELKVDGVLCYQNYAALGLIAELVARGQSVPQDVSVVGFDDLPPGNSPALGVTTYEYPSDRMAEQALHLMRERLRNPQRAPAKVVVPGRLIVRESSTGKRPTAHIMSGCPS
jgi:LacI family transcriptional regulator